MRSTRSESRCKLRSESAGPTARTTMIMLCRIHDGSPCGSQNPAVPAESSESGNKAKTRRKLAALRLERKPACRKPIALAARSCQCQQASASEQELSRSSQRWRAPSGSCSRCPVHTQRCSGSRESPLTLNVPFTAGPMATASNKKESCCKGEVSDIKSL